MQLLFIDRKECCEQLDRYQVRKSYICY